MKVKDIWQRLGTIKLTLDFLKELDLDEAKEIFGRLIIIESVSSHYPNASIEFRCVSQEFELISASSRVPEYQIEVKRNKKNGKLEWIKFIK